MRTAYMFAIQVASLTPTLSLSHYSVNWGVRGAAGIHTLRMLTLHKPTDDLRSPERHKANALQYTF